MKSRIYSGQVRHRRFAPRDHEFSYRLFMMYLDLDELPTLFAKYWLWSSDKPNLAWFDRKQHTGNKNQDLATTIREKVKQEVGIYPDGPIRLLTHLKYFGFGFNPVSFYFCFDKADEQLCAIVAEVNNTPWNEQHCYVFTTDQIKTNVFRFQFNKTFHVSPFNGMDQQYDWRFTIPGEKLAVHMNVFENGEQQFDATMKMQSQEITSRSLAKTLVTFPFMTTRIVAAIYYQALKLWLKRMPFYTHPAKQNPLKMEKKS